MTDSQAVIRAINRAEEVWDGLKVRGELRSRGGVGASNASASRAPLDLGMLDLADEIAGLMQSWTRLAHEESGDDLPADDVPAQAAWMRARVVWIAGAEWAPDMVDELEARARKGVGMLGMLTPRTALPEPCAVCDARQWVYHERPPIVRCREGHESQLVEHLQGRGVEVISQERAAWVLDIPCGSVSRWVRTGRLAGSSEGVTVASVRMAFDNMHRDA